MGALLLARRNPSMPRQAGVLGTRLPLVATRAGWPDNKSAGTEKTTTYRTRHFAVASAQGLRLVYVNAYSVSGSAVEVNAATPIRIAAALEYPLGTVHAATFGGARTTTIAPGSFAVSDPVAVDLPAGALFWGRQTAFQDGGSVWPLKGASVALGGNGGRDGDSRGWKVFDATNASPIVLFGNGDHGFQTGDSATVAGIGGNTAANGTWTVTRIDATHVGLNGSTGNGAFSASGSMAGSDQSAASAGDMYASGGELVMMPCAILGRVAGLGDQAQPWAAIVGDSIASGDASWIMAGMGGPFASRPVLNVAVPGTRASWFANPALAPSQSERRRRLALDAPYVFIQHGRNDLGNGDSAATLQANVLAIAASVAARGGRMIVSTVTPGTTSTDGWASAGSQTPLASESARVAYNQWVRGGCGGSPLVWRTLDPCALCEVNAANGPTVDGGRWVGGGTSDGIHPTAATAAAMGSATGNLLPSMNAF